MTFKQALRRLFADLWWRCADMAKQKMWNAVTSDLVQQKWWEEFMVRCEQRAMKHAEFVPGKFNEKGGVDGQA